jgi:hypothetical protein
MTPDVSPGATSAPAPQATPEVSLLVSGWDGAGLSDLSVGIKDFGEPAPTIIALLPGNCH